MEHMSYEEAARIMMGDKKIELDTYTYTVPLGETSHHDDAEEGKGWNSIDLSIEQYALKGFSYTVPLGQTTYHEDAKDGEAWTSVDLTIIQPTISKLVDSVSADEGQYHKGPTPGILYDEVTITIIPSPTPPPNPECFAEGVTAVIDATENPDDPVSVPPSAFPPMFIAVGQGEAVNPNGYRIVVNRTAAPEERGSASIELLVYKGTTKLRSVQYTWGLCSKGAIPRITRIYENDKGRIAFEFACDNRGGSLNSQITTEEWAQATSNSSGRGTFTTNP